MRFSIFPFISSVFSFITWSRVTTGAWSLCQRIPTSGSPWGRLTTVLLLRILWFLLCHVILDFLLAFSPLYCVDSGSYLNSLENFFFFFNANSESSWVRPQAPCHLPWAVVSISVQLSRSLLWGHGSAPSRAQQGAQDRSSFVRQITRRVGFSGWLLSPALSSSDFLLQSSAHRDPISASSIQKDGILPRAVAAAASIVVSSRLSLHQEQSPHLTVQSHFNRCKQCNIFRPLDSGVENLCLYPSENWSNLYLKTSIPTDGKKYINQIKGNHVFCTLLFYFSKVA